MRRPGERAWWPYAFIAPALVVYVAFVFLPVLDTFRYSFFRWDGLTAPVLVGLDNYLRALGDPVFLQSLGHNLALSVWFCLIPIGIGLLVASLIARSGLPGAWFFRTAVFLPQVLSLVVVGVVWRWIYSPAFGPVNQFLATIGLGDWARPWLGDFDFALPAVGVIGTWFEFGFVTVLMIAGVQKIDETLYEAARLDGASSWRQFRNITMPALRNEITVALVFTLIASFRIFDLVFVLTKGGPGSQTSVLSFFIYKSAFQRNELGYAAAMAVVLTMIILVISVLVVRLRERSGAEP
ncbi:MAG: sugar ABC transporter permease [Chloroflexota bacterium]|nr:sugar ABC transporter permease [Chloroflexota bacterium]